MRQTAHLSFLVYQMGISNSYRPKEDKRKNVPCIMYDGGQTA